MMLTDAQVEDVEALIRAVRTRLRDIERNPHISRAILIEMARRAARLGGATQLEALREFMNAAIDDELDEVRLTGGVTAPPLLVAPQNHRRA